MILLQGLRARGKIIGGVESVVPQKFPQRSVDSVCTRAGNDIGRRAQTIPEFGVGVVSEDVEFGDGVHGRSENEAPVHPIEIDGSVDQEVVRLGPLTVHSVRLSVPQRSPRFR